MKDRLKKPTPLGPGKPWHPNFPGNGVGQPCQAKNKKSFFQTWHAKNHKEKRTEINARSPCKGRGIMYHLVMENEINLSATESQALTVLEWVKVRNAIESKMEELDSAAQWAEEKGYDSESYYRNEYAALSAILKKMAK